MQECFAEFSENVDDQKEFKKHWNIKLWSQSLASVFFGSEPSFLYLYGPKVK